MKRRQLLALMGGNGSMWQARCGDDADSHLTAWAWLRDPDGVELYGDTPEFRHATYLPSWTAIEVGI